MDFDTALKILDKASAILIPTVIGIVALKYLWDKGSSPGVTPFRNIPKRKLSDYLSKREPK